MQVSSLLAMTAILVALALDCSYALDQTIVLSLDKPRWFFTPKGVTRIAHSGDIAYRAFRYWQLPNDEFIIARDPISPAAQVSKGGGPINADSNHRELTEVSEPLQHSRLLVISSTEPVRVELYARRITECHKRVVLSPEDTHLTAEEIAAMTPVEIHGDPGQYLEYEDDYEGGGYTNSEEQHLQRAGVPRLPRHEGWPNPANDPLELSHGSHFQHGQEERHHEHYNNGQNPWDHEHSGRFDSD